MSISSIGNRLEETFLSSRKRILSSVVGVILLLSVPVTLSLVYQQQDLRQRAEGVNPFVNPGGWGQGGADNPNSPGLINPSNLATDLGGSPNSSPGNAVYVPPGGSAPGGFTMGPATEDGTNPPGQENSNTANTQSLGGAVSGFFGALFGTTTNDVGGGTGGYPTPTPIQYCTTGGNYIGTVGGTAYNCSGGNIQVTVYTGTQGGGTKQSYYTIDCPAGTACARLANSCVACVPPTPTPTKTPTPIPTALITNPGIPVSPSPTPTCSPVPPQCLPGSRLGLMCPDAPPGGWCTTTPTPVACDSDVKNNNCFCKKNEECVSNYCNIQGATTGIPAEVFGYCDNPPSDSGKPPPPVPPSQSCSTCLAGGARYLCSPPQVPEQSYKYCSAIDGGGEGDSCIDCGAPSQTGATLSLDLILPGVGTNPARNNNPKRSGRIVSVAIYDSTGKPVKTVTGTVNYANGSYKGVVDLGSLPAGAYELKVRLDNTLYKRIPGTFIVQTGKENLAPAELELIAGDTKGSNLVDLTDYNIILACYAGSCPDDKKILADFNDDGVIDLKDLNILLRAFANRLGD